MRIFPFLFSILLLIINVKRIRVTDYSIVIFAYLCICIIQTYNNYPSIFKEFSIDLLVIVCMVMLCIVPIKDDEANRIRCIEITEIFFTVLVLIIDILGLYNAPNDLSLGVTANPNYLGNLNACAFILAANFVFVKKKQLLKVLFSLVSVIYIWLIYIIF